MGHTAHAHGCQDPTLSIKIAQKPYIIGSLGPKALKYESFDAKGHMICEYESYHPSPCLQVLKVMPGLGFRACCLLCTCNTLISRKQILRDEYLYVFIYTYIYIHTHSYVLKYITLNPKPQTHTYTLQIGSTWPDRTRRKLGLVSACCKEALTS